jgi:hypothetical protein
MILTAELVTRKKEEKRKFQKKMSKIIQNIRNFLKSTKTASVVPIISDSPSKFTGNQENNIINPGEFFFNQEDNKLWLGRQDSLGNKSTELIYPAVQPDINLFTYPKILGLYHAFLEVTNYAGTASFAVWGNNILYAYPILLRTQVTIDQLLITTASTSAGASVWGLYNNSVNGPNELVFGTTPFSHASSSTKIYNLPTALTIPSGLYWVAYNTDSIVSIAVNNGTQIINVIGSTNTFSNAHSVVSRAYTYTGNLPASFGTITNSALLNVPAVNFRLA